MGKKTVINKIRSHLKYLADEVKIEDPIHVTSEEGCQYILFEFNLMSNSQKELDSIYQELMERYPRC